ncbi:MAG TPA: acetate uptake transporter [Tepidisphaeraceae bacterium]|nr:acetate uptake transporter [Tepidisphaeraceae bacterium]
MLESNVVPLKERTANPGPLGLFGFGLSTVLLNLHSSGFFDMNSMILAMGLCYGGAAQVVVGIMEYKNNNTFGTTASLSYGFFWLSFVTLDLLPRFTDSKLAPDHVAMAAYYVLWGLFTLGLFIATLRMTRALQVVFGTLALLFFLLAAGEYFELGDSFNHLTGYEGILCGLSAFYAAIAQILNEVFEETTLPMAVVRSRRIENRRDFPGHAAQPVPPVVPRS